jgi:hypothetical protein
MCFRRCLRGDAHGSSAAARLLTVAVLVAAYTAQLASLAHEITVLHFRCPEHGELTHLMAPAAPAEISAEEPAQTAAHAPGGQAAEAHEHCGLAFTVEGRAFSPADVTVVDLVPPLSPTFTIGPPAREPGCVFLLASAPKTSPPTV